MKRATRITLTTLAALLLLVVLTIGSLFTHPVQRLITHHAAHILQQQTGYQLTINDIQYHPIHTITLTDATIAHPNTDSIIHIPALNIQFRWLPLLRHTLHITTIDLQQTALHIHIYADGTSNIDILRNIRPNPNFRYTLQIDNINLQQTTLTIDNDLPQKHAPQGTFNPHHIHINNLTTNITLNHYSRNNIIGSINHLTLTETSGIHITNLQTQIAINDTTLTMPLLHLQTPNTNLHLDTLRLTYPTLRQFLHLQTDATLQALITPSNIHLPDLAPFYTPLNNLRKPLTLQGTFTGSLDSLQCTTLTINYADLSTFNGNLTATHLRALDSLTYQANITHLQTNTIGLQDIIASLKRTPYQLPQPLPRLGTIQYNGIIEGNLQQATLHGQLTTNVGTLHTDCQLTIHNQYQDYTLDGTLKSPCLHLQRLLPDSQLGDATFTINTNTQFGHNTPLAGTIHANIQQIQYRNYNYQDIYFKGDYTSKNFLGEIIFNDDNGTLDATGDFQWDKQNPQYTFSATIDNFHPYNMHLIPNYPNLTIGLSVNTNITTTSIDNLQGQLQLTGLHLQACDTTYTLDTLTLTANHTDSLEQISLTSPLITANLTGQYTLTQLKSDLTTTLHKYLPALATNTPQPITNQFSYQLSINHIDSLLRILNIKWNLADTITSQGYYTPDSLFLTFDLPYLQKQRGKSNFRNINLSLYNESDFLHLHTSVDMHAPKFATTLNANLTATNDTITTLLQWNSNREKLFEGEFLARTFLIHAPQFNTITDILPTQFYLKDSLWNISPSHVYSDLHAVLVDSLSLYRQGQYISIDGAASKDITDTLSIQLKNIDLEYISTFIPSGTITFGGEATGEGYITNTFTKPIFIANANVPYFSLNSTYMGEANASTGWDIDKKALIIQGKVNNGRIDVADINGHYFFSNDSLDLFGHAEELNLGFLNYWLEPITLFAQGEGFGDTHIYGKKKEITVTAKALAKNAKIGVEYLKTAYTFNDSVILTPDSILFKDIQVNDKQGNKGIVNGYVAHKYFKDFNYNIDINVDNVRVMNTNEKDNSYFYGQVYATGNANISGNDNIGTLISVSAMTEPRTKVIIPISNTSNAKDNSFVKFINNSPQLEEEEKTIDIEQHGMNMVVNLKIDVQPSAEAILYIDPSTGDILKAYGDGDLIVNYDAKTDEMQLFGEYTLSSGSYTFTFQNALRKDFKIHNGSTIRWEDGFPYNAEVDINASYQLTASLTDILDKSVLAYTSRTSVPVQCLLHLTGNLTHPNIQFGLNLPNSDEELNRALHSVVSTDEIMNREIIYLLAMGKFYTPEYMQMTAQGELLALASSTLSSQLNNWASQLFEDWDFGVNFRSSGEGSDKSNEYEFSFLYAPNDRLTVNGNVGYLDDNLSASKFIGDVDAEYKLIPSGKLSVKAYNHTNDYKEFKNSLTTQGVGFVWRESFSSGKALRKEWQISIARQKAERAKKRAERAEKRRLKKENKK